MKFMLDFIFLYISWDTLFGKGIKDKIQMLDNPENKNTL